MIALKNFNDKDISLHDLLKSIDSNSINVENRNGEINRFKFLLNLDSKRVHEKTYNGDSLLHFAAFYDGLLSITTMLIQKGANIHEKNKAGLTPLHYAGKTGNAEICTLLLKAGADIDARDNAGNSPLHWACLSRKNVVTLLIEWNANIDALNNFDETPKDLIRNESFKGFVESEVLRYQNWENRKNLLMLLSGCRLVSLAHEEFLNDYDFSVLHKGTHKSIVKAFSWGDYYIEISAFL